jgi:Spy/CpxP family protein refolding chaperone
MKAHRAFGRSACLRRDIGCVLLGASLCAGLSLACSKSNQGTGGSASSSASAVASVAPATNPSALASGLMKHGGPRPHGGPTTMMIFAAKKLDLKDDKKASLQKVEDQLKTDESAASPKDEAKELNSDLSAQIKAGKIDQAKLEPHIAAIEKETQTRHEKEAEGLNGLHALLDPAQRKTVVADIRAKQEKREEHAKDKEDPAKDKAERAKKRLEHVTKELDLDDAQQKKVEAILAKEDPKAPDVQADMKKRMDAMLTAFEQDTFDAKKLEMFSGAGKQGRGMFTKEVTFMSQLVPILKPEQREKLATQTESRAAHMRMGRPGEQMMPSFLGAGPHGDGSHGEEGSSPK